MSRFIEGEARTQSLLFPERLDDWVAEDNPVRVIDAFVEELDLKDLSFVRDPRSHSAAGRRRFLLKWRRPSPHGVIDACYCPAYHTALSKSSHQPPRPLPIESSRSTTSMRSTYFAFLYPICSSTRSRNGAP